jgi:hypothetical protein
MWQSNPYTSEWEHEPVKFGRFMIIWQQKTDGWKIKRVVSLH